MNQPLQQSEDHPARRSLHFTSLDAVLADAEQWLRLDYHALGQWSLGQIGAHLAILMTFSPGGFPFKGALHYRLLGRWMKNRLLNDEMAAGIRFTERIGAALRPPSDITDAEGVDRLRYAIGRLQHEPQRHLSPLLGHLSVDQWNAFHCRHAELHLSFIAGTQHVHPGADHG
jgi:hypothetical protein